VGDGIGLHGVINLSGNQAVALLDLSGLHDVNNSLGHAAGDEVLRSVARRLSSASEGIAKAYRLSGVRFVLLVSGASDPLGFIAGIRKVVGKLAEPIEVSGKSVSISADVGIVLEAEAGRGTDELLADADLALYHAKAKGRDGYALFASFMRADANARRALAKEIDKAFKLGQLELFFQPQVRLSDLGLVGAEALLRWNHPTMGVVPPSIFLDALAASPIVAEVGDWVLRSACCEAAEWRHMASSEIFVSANLFQWQIANPALPKSRPCLPKLAFQLTFLNWRFQRTSLWKMTARFCARLQRSVPPA
jgi:diguanylate cyclase (GGDEF)-like protein